MLSAIGYPLFAVAALEVLLGTILLRHNPRRSRVNAAVAVFAFASAGYAFFSGLVFVRASLGLPLDLYVRLRWIGWLSIPAALQALFFMQQADGRGGKVGWTLYPFWVLSLLLCIFTDLMEPGGYSLLPAAKRVGLLEHPVRFLGALQILWVIVEVFRLRSRATGFLRMQIQYFSYGIVIYGIGGALIPGFLRVFTTLGIDAGFGAYFSLPWVILTFYAITRYRLFDIRLILSRVVADVLLAVLFIGAHVFLFKLFVPSLGPILAILFSLGIISVIFLATPFNGIIQPWLTDLVLKDRYGYQKTLKASIQGLLRTLDLDELRRAIIDGISASFGAATTLLCLNEEDDASGMPGTGALGWIGRRGGIVLREELEESRSEPEARELCDYLDKARAELVIPLMGRGSLLGLLMLGPKKTGEPYEQGDLELLETLACQAVIAIENARLYNQVRQANRSVQSSEIRFRTLAQTTPAAIFIHRGGGFLFVNKAGELLSGYPEKELLSMNFRDLVHPEHRDLVAQLAGSRMTDAGPKDQYEFKVIRKDGTERWVLMTAAHVEYEGMPAVIGTLLDISDRKALEGKLRYAQKMEAIGKLAGGVAHDFNNVLTAIVGYANLMHLKMSPDDPLCSSVDSILAASERAANMTQSLLAFGKKQVVNLGPGELNGIVRCTERILVGLVREGVRLDMRYAGEQLPILADSSQIERIIMNLFVNARDAMPGGGTVTIRTGSSALDGDFIRSYGYGRPGRYAVASVTDTGQGMDDEIKKKIFEPFFTTKGLEKGTGFGLSIVYDIVKEHNGYITVSSAPGQGATFTVYLPLTAAAPAAAAVEERGTGTVLVAENEHEMRLMMKAVLEGHGYAVIEAGDGQEAVEKFFAHEDDIHLLLLDVIMPRMNGIEAYRAIRRKHPHVKTVFTSGYAEDDIRGKGMIDDGQHFIAKPFAPKDLLGKVREVLNRNS